MWLVSKKMPYNGLNKEKALSSQGLTLTETLPVLGCHLLFPTTLQGRWCYPRLFSLGNNWNKNSVWGSSPGLCDSTGHALLSAIPLEVEGQRILLLSSSGWAQSVPIWGMSSGFPGLGISWRSWCSKSHLWLLPRSHRARQVDWPFGVVGACIYSPNR